MKSNWRSSLFIATILVVAMSFMLSCNKNGDHADHADHADIYTCPMHPTVVSDRPGSCPVCGMDLVRKARAGEEVEMTENLAELIKSPSEIVIASIKTIKGEYKSMPISTQAQGIVTYDTRNIYAIPTRIGGRLEKVYLKYPFQQVRKGQKIAEIYSPELLTAQRELLFLLQNDSENQALVQRAKERLRLLGANESQLNDLIQRKEPKNTFGIYSPYDGYVISDTQQTPAAPMSGKAAPVAAGSGMSDGMGESSSVSNVPLGATGGSISSTNQELIREGSYVSSGETLFKVVNPADLRVELNITSPQAGSIKKGSNVMLNFGDQQDVPGTIDFIQPFFNEGQEFLTVSVYTTNTERLHIGHLVKAVIESNPVEALWVPKESVLDLGVDNVVFIKANDVFKPRKVITGVHAGNQIEIKQGLSSSDEIAANAQYLVDSESFIKTK